MFKQEFEQFIRNNPIHLLYDNNTQLTKKNDSLRHQIKRLEHDLHISKKLAQEIYDAVLNAFPKLKTFREESRQMARDLGYVTTAWGRKRRLPDMQLLYFHFYIQQKNQSDID